jgi:BON domain
MACAEPGFVGTPLGLNAASASLGNFGIRTAKMSSPVLLGVVNPGVRWDFGNYGNQTNQRTGQTMKLKISGLCFALSLGLATAAVTGLSGCAGDRYERSTGEYIDDKSLTARVKGALGDNSEYKFSDVNVAAFRGTVQLSGFVNTSDQKRKAADIAEKVQGVKDIENNITVKEKKD